MWSEYKEVRFSSDDEAIQKVLDSLTFTVLFHEPDGNSDGDEDDELKLVAHGTVRVMGEELPLHANIGVWDNMDGVILEGEPRAIDLAKQLIGCR